MCDPRLAYIFLPALIFLKLRIFHLRGFSYFFSRIDVLGFFFVGASVFRYDFYVGLEVISKCAKKVS